MKNIKILIFKKHVIITLIFVFAVSILAMMPGVGRTMTGQNNAPTPTQGSALTSGDNYVSRGLAKKLADGKVELNDPQEVKEKRTVTSKTFFTGWDKDGQKTYRGRFYSGPIHYMDKSTGALEDISTDMTDEANDWSMDKADYGAKIKKKLGDKFITFKNQDQEIYFSLPEYPKGEIAGKINNQNANDKGGQAKYQNALGQGIDLDVTLGNDYLKKEVVINSLNSLGDLKGKDNYDITFVLLSNQNIDIKSGDDLLSQKEKITTSDQVEVLGQNGITSYIREPYAEGNSDAINNAIGIQITYELKDGMIYLTKHLPIDWLKKATFPVKTDATLSPNTISGAGDGHIGLLINNATAWDQVHNATNATDYLDYTSGYIYNFAEGTGGNNRQITRAFFPFNTSAMGANAKVTSARMYIKTNSTGIFGTVSAGLVETSQATTSSLTGDDYDNCGSTHNPTEGATRISISSTETWYNFILNTTGVNWVNPTGWTKLGIRYSNDLDDIDPGNNRHATFYYSGDASSENRPYMLIDYIPNSTAINLKVEGQTNPSKVTDPWPEFYATDDNIDTNSYQIQISASSTEWSSNLVWDSGKNSMATTTKSGRSLSITYGSTTPFAFDGSKYYWRIKFWSTDDIERLWSDGTDNFTMASKVRLVFPD